MVDYHVNSLGLRDASARQVPLHGPHRLLFVGDSFTEGIGVEYEKTFVGLVSGALAARGVEVLNAGCASYSPITYYRKVRWLLEQGLEIDEVAVYIDVGDVLDEVTYVLDADGNVQSDERRRIHEERENIRYSLPRPLRDLTVRQLLKRHTTGLFALYSWMEEALKTEDRRAALWTVDPGLFEQFGREGLARARAHMDLLADLLRGRKIRLTVAVYPWPDQVRRGDLHSLHVEFWRKWAAEKGADFVDYFPRFVIPGRGPEVLARVFIPGDIHWNESGHQIIADGFLAARSER
jgi:hypothetical protein